MYPEQDYEECGIGIKVTQAKGRYQVSEITAGGPASLTQQIFVGDSILQIDGISVFGKRQQEVMDLLFGPADTILELEMERESQPGKRLSIVVRRQPSPRKPKTGASSASALTPSPAAPSGAAALADEDGVKTPIDLGRALGRSAGPDLSQLSWDPEDEDGDSQRSAKTRVRAVRVVVWCVWCGGDGDDWRRFSQLDKCMHACVCVCVRARARVRARVRDGVRGGQSPANYDSAAERLAAENLQLLSEKHRLAAENAVLQKTVARLRVRLDEAGVLDSDDASSTGERERERGRLLGGKSELSLDPSAWVDWGDGEEEGEGESEIDPSEAGGWGEAELSEGSFDPSEGDLGEAGGGDKCGIGVTLHRGEDGEMRILSLTHGGPADLSGQVRVGDILRRVDDTDISHDLKKASVVALLKGRAGSKVRLQVEREGRRISGVVERDEADQRVWKVLSQYSELHPEDFQDVDWSADPHDASDDSYEEELVGPAGAPRAGQGVAERGDAGAKKKVKSATAIKASLDRKNEEIEMLKAQLAEAEAGKEGMVKRINTLLTRASELEADHLHQQQQGPTPSPPRQRIPPPLAGGQAPSHADGAAAARAVTSAASLPRGPSLGGPLAQEARGGQGGQGTQGGHAQGSMPQAAGGAVGEGVFGVGLVLQIDTAASAALAGGATGAAEGGQSFKVLRVLEGSSSLVSRQVQVGDVVLTVGGVALRAVAADDVPGLVDGPYGTSVVLGLQRFNVQGLRYVTYVSLDRRSPPTPTPAPVPTLTATAEEHCHSPPPVGTAAGGGGDRRGDGGGGGEGQCSVGLLVRRNSRGYLKVRGFAAGGPAERCGQIKVGHVLVQVRPNPNPSTLHPRA